MTYVIFGRQLGCTKNICQRPGDWTKEESFKLFVSFVVILGPPHYDGTNNPARVSPPSVNQQSFIMNISFKFLSLFLCLWPALSQEAAAVVEEDEERPASRRLGYWFGYDTIESFVGQNSRLSTLYDALVAIEAAPGGT